VRRSALKLRCSKILASIPWQRLVSSIEYVGSRSLARYLLLGRAHAADQLSRNYRPYGNRRKLCESSCRVAGGWGTPAPLIDLRLNFPRPEARGRFAWWASRDVTKNRERRP
jgi:hypothetical protein